MAKASPPLGIPPSPTNAIVTRTGHTEGAFYGHFENKQQVFQHVLAYRQELTHGWTQTLRDYDPSDTTLGEALAIVVTRLGDMLPGANEWILVLVDFYQQTKHDPDTHRLLTTKYEQWIDGIEELVQALQEQGWVARDRDARQIARQIIAFNEG